MHRLDNELMRKSPVRKKIVKNISMEKKREKRKYDFYIDKIIDASSEEILFKGFIGHHAELSSAKELRSEGCLCQTWSSAMFIELINEVYFKKITEF